MTMQFRRRERLSMKRLPSRTLLYVSLSVAAFIILLPVLWMVSAAVRPEGNIVSHPAELIPTVFTFDNFREIWTAIPFLHELRNTVIFAGSVTCVSLLFDSMTAYALARLDFPGKRVFFLLVLHFLMVPPQITLIPVYQIVARRQADMTAVASVCAA